MADYSDAANALVVLAAQTIYPNGTGQPSVSGCDVRLYQGWPIQQRLDDDLAAGRVHVSVYPRPEERRTTRYPREWKQQTIQAATLTLTVAGQQITAGGTLPTAGAVQNLAVVAGGSTYTYQASHADTLTSIATAFAALIPGASNVGPAITIPTGVEIQAARVGGTGTMAREVRRQERLFQITVWAPTPAKRSAVLVPIDQALADTPFLTMPDGFMARLLYKSSPVSDQHQKDNLYRRDLLYTVEFATTQEATATEVIAPGLGLSVQTDTGAPVSSVQINF